MIVIASVIGTWAVLTTLACERQVKVATLIIERRRELDEAERLAAAKKKPDGLL